MSRQLNPYLLTLPQLLSAKKKIGSVAAFYDPNSSSLRGFDSEALDATQFREQLRRNFLVNLTDEELGAIVFLFDKDGDGKVDSVEFINEFFRLGKIEKEKQRATKVELDAWVLKKKMERIKSNERRFQKFAEVKVASTWTEADEKSSIRKIAKVAFTYDKGKGGLEAFLNCTALTPGEFREQIRRNFFIDLSPAETGALVKLFDADGNGMIDSKEFVYSFFRIGREEKDRHNRRQAKQTLKMNRERAQRKKEVDERYCKLVEAQLETAKDADFESVREKIRLAAIAYDNSSMFNNLQKSFESADMNPTMFKEMLKTNFNIILTPSELDAAVRMFDLNGDGTISCAEFTSTFFKMKLNEKSQMLQEQRQRTKDLLEKEAEQARKKAILALEKVRTNVIWPVLPFDENEEDNDDNDDNNEQQLNSNSIAISGKENAVNSMESLTMTSLDRSSSMFRASSAPSSRELSTSKDTNNRKPRTNRKPTMMEILMPHKKKIAENLGFSQMLNNSSIVKNGNESIGDDSVPSISLASFFPKASQDTKNFITSLEETERKLKDFEKRKKKAILERLGKPNKFTKSLVYLPKLNKSIASSCDGGNDSNQRLFASPIRPATVHGGRKGANTSVNETNGTNGTNATQLEMAQNSYSDESYVREEFD